MPLMPQLRAWPRPALRLLDPLPHRPIEPLPLARVKPAAQLRHNHCLAVADMLASQTPATRSDPELGSAGPAR
jgi:hypothetical protein